MSKETQGGGSTFSLSLDSWAVILAFALALVVRFGWLKNVPW